MNISKWQDEVFYSTSYSYKNPGVHIQNLSLYFNNKEIFRDVDFSLLPGDKVTLVGENGIGKSTFLKLLLGDIANYGGKVKVRGKVGYLPQSFENFNDSSAIEHLVLYSKDPNLIDFVNDNSQKKFTHSWYEEFNSIGGFSLLKSFAQLGLATAYLEKSIFMLSGGEKIKLHLCALEYLDPDILLLDEPTNHLDAQGIGWLSRYLKKFNGGVIMVTHYRSLISTTSNRISELSPITHNFIHFRGGYKNYLLEQERIYEKIKLERLKQEKELKSIKGYLSTFQSSLQSTIVRRLPKNKDKLGFNARGERKQKSQSKLVNQLKYKMETLEENLIQVPGFRQKIGFNLLHNVKTTDISLEVENLTKKVGELTLFDSLNLTLKNRDRLIITGKNGSGKTTLLKIISGIILPDEGSVYLSSNVKLGFLDQEQDVLELDNTSFEILSKYSEHLPQGENVITFLEKFGIYHTHDLHIPLSNVSAGCRRKVQLAKIILCSCNVLLLDEPTNHIDLVSLERIEEQLLEFPGVVIAVSHDRYFIEKIATKTLDIEKY